MENNSILGMGTSQEAEKADVSVQSLTAVLLPDREGGKPWGPQWSQVCFES